MESNHPTNILAHVRGLMPPRPLTGHEAKTILERQAMRLLKLCEVDGPPVPTEIIVERLPRVTLKRAPTLPDSGRVQWNGRQWVILVAADEAPVRQRFSIVHEIAHVVLHPLSDVTMPATARQTAEQRLEVACEYFAACLLMPRLWMKRAHAQSDLQDLPGLARLFEVSWPACHIRLEQLGLINRVEYSRSAA